MGREEAAHWLGMAMRRKHPRRVLTALRCLLADRAETVSGARWRCLPLQGQMSGVEIAMSFRRSAVT